MAGCSKGLWDFVGDLSLFLDEIDKKHSEKDKYLSRLEEKYKINRPKRERENLPITSTQDQAEINEKPAKKDWREFNVKEEFWNSLGEAHKEHDKLFPLWLRTHLMDLVDSKKLPNFLRKNGQKRSPNNAISSIRKRFPHIIPARENPSTSKLTTTMRKRGNKPNGKPNIESSMNNLEIANLKDPHVDEQLYHLQDNDLNEMKLDLGAFDLKENDHDRDEHEHHHDDDQHEHHHDHDTRKRKHKHYKLNTQSGALASVGNGSTGLAGNGKTGNGNGNVSSVGAEEDQQEQEEEDPFKDFELTSPFFQPK